LYFAEILSFLNDKVHTSISRFLKLAFLINKLNNPLEDNKALQYLAWLKVVNVLNDQVKTDKRDTESEKLIKELSRLK